MNNKKPFSLEGFLVIDPKTGELTTYEDTIKKPKPKNKPIDKTKKPSK